MEIKGEFFQEHRDEIVHLINNVEKQEKDTHPLERIMKMSDTAKGLTVQTTGVHIARRIGEALNHSYKGTYTFQYADDEQIIRCFWQR